MYIGNVNTSSIPDISTWLVPSIATTAIPNVAEEDKDRTSRSLETTRIRWRTVTEGNSLVAEVIRLAEEHEHFSSES